MADHPIPHVEIPRPPVAQPPECLYLFVCDSEEPDPPGRFWGNQQAMLGGMQGGIAGAYPAETKRPVFRRATPDDLLAFGFAAIPPGIPDLPTEDSALSLVLQSVMNRLTAPMRTTMLALLQEKYG